MPLLTSDHLSTIIIASASETRFSWFEQDRYNLGGEKIIEIYSNEETNFRFEFSETLKSES